MPTSDKLTSQDQDYRASHLQKGARYDATLADAPFDAYMSAWEGRHVPAMVRRFYPQGPERYLDFACGTGRVTSLIAPLARKSTGVDISPTMIEEARVKCPNTRFELADLTRDEVDVGDFDLISSFRFFGNAQDELREGALRALVRRLVPGGHLIINSHRNPRSLAAMFDRVTGGSAGEMDLHLPKLRALLARHGLEIRALQPIGAWMFRSRLMALTRPDDERAVRNEARFGATWLSPIAPDVIVVARKR